MEGVKNRAIDNLDSSTTPNEGKKSIRRILKLFIL